MGDEVMKNRHRQKRISVSSTVNQDVALTLDMLGFDVPRLIEEILSNVADLKRCPCCKRQLRPVITGKKPKELD